MKYRLKVNQPNKVFTIRGKPTRTPFTIDNVNETELKVFQSKIKLESIPEDMYEIIPMDEVIKQEQVEKENKSNKTDNNTASETKTKSSKSTSSKSKSTKSGSKKSKSKAKTTLDSYSEDGE